MDTIRFPVFSPRDDIRGIFGDPLAQVIPLVRRSKKTSARAVAECIQASTAARREEHATCSVPIPDLPRFEVRHLRWPCTGKVGRERLDFVADNLLYTKRFAWFVGRRCRSSTIKDVAKELNLRWGAVKEVDKQYMRGTAGAGRPIWFGAKDRSEASMKGFYDWLGPKKAKKGIRLALMDTWMPFRNATQEHAPQGAILLDKFRVMRHLNEALDKVRKSEYARLSGTQRRYIRGQKYVLLSHRENLTADGR